jgi:uncharacterized integral membrane protein
MWLSAYPEPRLIPTLGASRRPYPIAVPQTSLPRFPMRPSANVILIILMSAVWAIATAVIAMQNAEGVFLTFLGAQSITLPLGLVLALSVALGMVGAVALRLLGSPRRRRSEFYEDPVD